MSDVLRILLGHLIGDFVLQTIDLVRLKSSSWKGLFLHAGIVIGCTALLLWSDLGFWWPWLPALFLLHLGVDWGKIRLSRRFPRWDLGLFFLDQVAHLAAIALITVLARRGWPFPSLSEFLGGTPERNRQILFLLGFLSAFFIIPLIEVLVACTIVHRNPTRNHGPSSPEEQCRAASLPDRLWGGGERTAVLALLYIGGWVVWFAPLVFLPRIVALRGTWAEAYPARIYRIRIATSVVSMIVIGLVLWFLDPLC